MPHTLRAFYVNYQRKIYAYSGFMFSRKKKKALCRRYFRLYSPLITRMANIELFVFRSLLRKYCGCYTLWDKSEKKKHECFNPKRCGLLGGVLFGEMKCV